jgi:hypothetical protein
MAAHARELLLDIGRFPDVRVDNQAAMHTLKSAQTKSNTKIPDGFVTTTPADHFPVTSSKKFPVQREIANATTRLARLSKWSTTNVGL